MGRGGSLMVLILAFGVQCAVTLRSLYPLRSPWPRFLHTGLSSLGSPDMLFLIKTNPSFVPALKQGLDGK